MRYFVDGGSVLMCFGSDVPFGAVVDEVVAAFEVESIDPEAGTGWSVHAQGILRQVGEAEGAYCSVGGGRVLRLEPVSIVGRYLGLARPIPLRRRPVPAG